jgi:hypothetical protein
MVAGIKMRSDTRTAEKTGGLPTRDIAARTGNQAAESGQFYMKQE